MEDGCVLLIIVIILVIIVIVIFASLVELITLGEEWVLASFIRGELQILVIILIIIALLIAPTAQLPAIYLIAHFNLLLKEVCPGILEIL